MDKFIVSARKYRPQTFDTVVGQEHITTTLKNSIRNNTLAHAFLFCGPRGVGKTTCARILAKTINCDNILPEGEACNACASCKSFNDGASMNIHELDAASNNRVEEMRDLISQVRFAPQEGKYKIYIIDEVHMLSTSAFNAFLKTLEEPPAHAKFILATTEKHKIIPTILSRCQIFDFKRITNDDVTKHLAEIAGKENIHTEKQALQLIGQKSEGCMRDALSIFDKIVSFSNSQVTYKETLEHLNILDEDVYFRLLEELKQQNLGAALMLYDEINQKGFEGNTFLEGLCAFLRNLMVSKDPKAAALLDVLEGMQQQYASAAKSTSLSYLVSALHLSSEALHQYREAQNKRLHVETTLVKLTYLQQALTTVMDPVNGKMVSKRTIAPPRLVKSKPVERALLNPPKDKPDKTEAATLTIKPAAKPEIRANESVPEKPHEKMVLGRAATPKPSALDKLQTDGQPATGNFYEKFKKKYQASVENLPEAEERPVRDPNLEEITIIWETYRDKMKEASKHSTVTGFDLADLFVRNNTLEIKCGNSFSKTCIDDELTDLVQIIHDHFNNSKITIETVLEVSPEEEKPKENGPENLNARERFRLMSEEYPLVKELKEKLKLNIEF